jgi:hypothetical protein
MVSIHPEKELQWPMSKIVQRNVNASVDRAYDVQMYLPFDWRLSFSPLGYQDIYAAIHRYIC